MKLWLLKPAPGWAKWRDNEPGDPWLGTYDCAYGFVVRAETEEEARNFASEQAGDEKPKAWLDEKFSRCEELLADGEPGMVIQDFLSG